jgi:hypothetical protein
MQKKVLHLIRTKNDGAAAVKLRQVVTRLRPDGQFDVDLHFREVGEGRRARRHIQGVERSAISSTILEWLEEETAAAAKVLDELPAD